MTDFVELFRIAHVEGLGVMLHIMEVHMLTKLCVSPKCKSLKGTLQFNRVKKTPQRR